MQKVSTSQWPHHWYLSIVLALAIEHWLLLVGSLAGQKQVLGNLASLDSITQRVQAQLGFSNHTWDLGWYWGNKILLKTYESRFNYHCYFAGVAKLRITYVKHIHPISAAMYQLGSWRIKNNLQTHTILTY